MEALEDLRAASRLRERVYVRFEKLIKKQEAALKQLKEDLEVNVSFIECWGSFRAIRQQCTSLFRECLAFLEGALSRWAKIDGGLCEIADAMLDEISHQADIHWGRFTIMAEGEFFADMAEIIRLRFPEVSIWNLPVAGHEFGHFVAQELKAPRGNGTFRFPFQEFLERESMGLAKLEADRKRAYLNEYFADLFAVYALGPAYACTCVLLRFDPGTAYRVSTSHPSAAKRVHWMLQVLRKMDQAEGGLTPPYHGITEHLQDLWQKSLVAAGQPAALDQEDAVQLDGWLDELYAVADSELPRVRYGGYLRAQGLSVQLSPEKYNDPVLQGDETLPDALNAAWLCRLQEGRGDNLRVHAIGENARKMCRRIMGEN
jgi:hypothetical protein